MDSVTLYYQIKKTHYSSKNTSYSFSIILYIFPSGISRKSGYFYHLFK